MIARLGKNTDLAAVYANEVILQKCCIIMMPGKQQILMTQIFLWLFWIIDVL